jgi:hypothetical protein
VFSTMQKNIFDAAMTRRMLAKAIETQASLEDMCTKLEASEKKEEERERMEKEEQEGSREAKKIIDEKMERSARWFEIKTRARQARNAALAAKEKAAEKKDPPVFADWWGSPVYISEDELVIKGVKGWSTQAVRALLVRAIGT